MIRENIDKIKHFLCCFFIGATIGSLIILLFGNLPSAMLAAGYSALLAGIEKEWCDLVYAKNWGWVDLASDVVGAAFAVLWCFLLTLG